MSLLAILISLGIEKFVHLLDQWRKFHWFINFSNWVKSKFEDSSYWNDTVGIIGIMLIPVAAVGFFLYELDSTLGLLSFIFSITVLVYCLGPKDLHEVAHLYLDACKQDDNEAAFSYATQLLNTPVPKDERNRTAAISKALLISTNERLLAVFFWFMVLGPMGTVLYRLSHVLAKAQSIDPDPERNEFYQSSRLLFAILNWLPLHLTTLSYAITGSFIDAVHQWKEHQPEDILNPDEHNTQLAFTGLGALNIDMDSNGAKLDLHVIHDVLELSRRSVFAFLTVIAILTLAGWAG